MRGTIAGAALATTMLASLAPASPWQGVSDDAILVVLYNDLGVEGPVGDPILVRTIQAHLRAFQARAETYGRQVRVLAESSSGESAGQRRRDALRVAFKYRPFAALYLGDGRPEVFLEQIAEFRTFGFVTTPFLPSRMLRRSAPFLWSFRADMRTAADLSAGFLCRSLSGLPARFAGDPSPASSERRFAVVHDQNPIARARARGLARAARADCRLAVDEPVALPTSPAGAGQMLAALSAMKAAGVTTIACVCASTNLAQTLADGNAYRPEWVLDRLPARGDVVPSQPTFGTTTDERATSGPTRAEESYREGAGESSLPPDRRWNEEIYLLFLQLFTAIEAAGPDPSPATIREGLFATDFRRLRYPWLPSGGYGPPEPGPYTFVDTGAAWWWDPAGTPPGGRHGEGCVRFANGGDRSYASSWPLGDRHLFAPPGPCDARLQGILPVL